MSDIEEIEWTPVGHTFEGGQNLKTFTEKESVRSSIRAGAFKVAVDRKSQLWISTVPEARTDVKFVDEGPLHEIWRKQLLLHSEDSTRQQSNELLLIMNEETNANHWVKDHALKQVMDIPGFHVDRVKLFVSKNPTDSKKDVFIYGYHLTREVESGYGVLWNEEVQYPSVFRVLKPISGCHSGDAFSIWLPEGYEHPWRGWTQSNKSLLRDSYHSTSGNQTNNSESDGNASEWVIWVQPDLQAQWIEAHTEGPLDMIDVMESGSPTHFTNEGGKIPLQLEIVNRRDSARGTGRSDDDVHSRIYIYKQKNKKSPVPSAIHRLLDDAQVGDVELSYMLLKEDIPAETKAENLRAPRFHVFKHTVNAGEKTNYENLIPLPDHVFELPSAFSEQGVYLPAQSRFSPDIEKNFSHGVEDVLVQFLGKISGKTDRSIVLVMADHPRKPSVWVLDESRFRPASSVIQAILESTFPEVLRRKHDELVKGATLEHLQSLLESRLVLTDQMESKLENVFNGHLDELESKYGEVQNTMENANQLLVSVEKHDKRIEDLFTAYLESGWDPFALEVYKIHAELLEKSSRWKAAVSSKVIAENQLSVASKENSEKLIEQVSTEVQLLQDSMRQLEDSLSSLSGVVKDAEATEVQVRECRDQFDLELASRIEEVDHSRERIAEAEAATILKKNEIGIKKKQLDSSTKELQLVHRGLEAEFNVLSLKLKKKQQERARVQAFEDRVALSRVSIADLESTIKRLMVSVTAESEKNKKRIGNLIVVKKLLSKANKVALSGNIKSVIRTGLSKIQGWLMQGR
jgi:hypothetical protein